MGKRVEGRGLDDREILRTQAYGQSAKLRARQALWSYAEAPPAGSRVSRAWPLRGEEALVDLGCGHGADLRALRAEGHRGLLVGVDFSVGMLSELEPDVAHRVNADASAIPLPASAADVVIAMHMLYHLTDMAAALRDAHRILRPEGVFLASTNSSRTAPELIEPWSTAMVAHGGPGIQPDPAGRFSIASGEALLWQVFGQVGLHVREGVTRVPEASVVRDYVASTDDLYEPLMPSSEAWVAVLDQVAGHAQRVIAEKGYFAVTARTGVFVCRGEAGG